MARYNHGLGGGGNASSDVYFPLISGGASSANSTTEAFAETKMYRPGVYSMMYIQLVANTAAGTSTAYFRKNGSNGNASISISAGGTGRFENTSAIDIIAANDKVCIFFDRGGNSTIGNIGAYFETNGSIQTVGSYGSTNFSAASTTTEVPQMGLLRSSGVGANGRIPNLAVMTSRNLQCYISSNTCSTTTTVQQRLNNTNATPAISVSAGGAGFFENTTDSQVYTVGQELYFQIIRGTGAGNFNMTMLAQDQVYDTPKQQIYQMVVTGQAWNSTLPVYTHPTGSYTTSGFESNVQMKLLGKGTISKFYTRLSANGATADVTYSINKNGSNTSLQTVFAAGVFNTASDTTDSASFEDGDLISIEYSKPTGTGTSTSRWFTFLVEYDEFIPQVICS